jgi:hypothetical protein
VEGKAVKKIFITMVLMGVSLGASADELSNAPGGAAVTQLQSSVPEGIGGNIQTPVLPDAGEEAVNNLPTEREISDVVAAQGFNFNNLGIVVTYFSPSNQQVTYQHDPDAWWYPASTTKVVVLTYAYYYAYLHRGQGETLNGKIVADDKPYIAKMILASDNDATLHLAKKYGMDKIQSFPKRVLGYDGIETGWYGIGWFPVDDRVTAGGMSRLISYIYDDRDAEAIPLPVKKEIRKWLELPKKGNTSLQNQTIRHFLNNPDLPNPYDPKSGLTVGMKAGWTDDASGHVACFNWRPQGSHWTIAIYHKGNWDYFAQIGNLHRDLFLLFRDKR